MVWRRALLWLARPLLVIAWGFVAWGHLIGLATLWNAITRGPATALALLRPSGEGSLWAWLNLVAPMIAILVWGLLLGSTWRRRRIAGDEE